MELEGDDDDAAELLELDVVVVVLAVLLLGEDEDEDEDERVLEDLLEELFLLEVRELEDVDDLDVVVFRCVVVLVKTCVENVVGIPVELNVGGGVIVGVTGPAVWRFTTL